MGVEPTIRPAKDRIAGFEDREGHRTPFASLAKVWQLSGCSIVGNMSEEHRPATDFLRVCKTGLRHEAENSALGIAFQAVT